MTAPTREQVVQWAQEAGFTVRNDIIKAVHSNGSWVELSERLALFAIQAYTEGMVAQAKRQSPPPITVDLRSIDPEMMSELLDRGRNFYGELKVMPDIIADRIAKLEQQRDDLLAAAEKAAQVLRKDHDRFMRALRWDEDIYRHKSLVYQDLMKAIASVKGGEA